MRLSIALVYLEALIYFNKTPLRYQITMTLTHSLFKRPFCYLTFTSTVQTHKGYQSKTHNRDILGSKLPPVSAFVDPYSSESGQTLHLQ